jgi:hypothetical protein
MSRKCGTSRDIVACQPNMTKEKLREKILFAFQKVPTCIVAECQTPFDFISGVPYECTKCRPDCLPLISEKL